MRKITQDAVKAFYGGYKFSRDNTRVENDGLYLHGHRVAWTDKRLLRVSSCGYLTNKTKERLNGVLKSQGFKIQQKDFEWYLISLETGRRYPFTDGVAISHIQHIDITLSAK